MLLQTKVASQAGRCTLPTHLTPGCQAAAHAAEGLAHEIEPQTRAAYVPQLRRGGAGTAVALKLHRQERQQQQQQQQQQEISMSCSSGTVRGTLSSNWEDHGINPAFKQSMLAAAKGLNYLVSTTHLAPNTIIRRPLRTHLGLQRHCRPQSPTQEKLQNIDSPSGRGQSQAATAVGVFISVLPDTPPPCPSSTPRRPQPPPLPPPTPPLPHHTPPPKKKPDNLTISKGSSACCSCCGGMPAPVSATTTCAALWVWLAEILIAPLAVYFKLLHTRFISTCSMEQCTRSRRLQNKGLKAYGSRWCLLMAPHVVCSA